MTDTRTLLWMWDCDACDGGGEVQECDVLRVFEAAGLLTGVLLADGAFLSDCPECQTVVTVTRSDILVSALPL